MQKPFELIPYFTVRFECNFRQAVKLQFGDTDTPELDLLSLINITFTFPQASY